MWELYLMNNLCINVGWLFILKRATFKEYLGVLLLNTSDLFYKALKNILQWFAAKS